MELFELVSKNAETRGKREVKARFVSMLEAAQRRSRKQPIVDQKPDPDWGGDGWKFWMTLKINDMVLWDKKGTATKERLLLERPVYRVQKTSSSGGRLDISFRHHSTVSSEGKDLSLIHI